MHFRIVQCSGCGLIYSNPILPMEEIEELYRRSEFISEEQLSHMVRDYLEIFLRYIGSMDKGALLEVGCANGFFLERIGEFGFTHCRGVEPGREAVEKASRTVRPFIVNDFLKPGMFPRESFDVVCGFQIFDHLIDPNGFLQMVRDYLKPGGRLLLIHHNIKALMPVLLGARASTYDISHIHLWDKKTMRLIFEKNGLKPEKMRNVTNRYQLDHVIRMLPLPGGLKEGTRQIFRRLHLSDLVIKAAVENMLCVGRK